MSRDYYWGQLSACAILGAILLLNLAIDGRGLNGGALIGIGGYAGFMLWRSRG